MKKIIYLSLIAGIFLTACSTGKNGMFTKRKYTKGIYVDSKGRATAPKENDLAKNTRSGEAAKAPAKIEKQVVPALENETEVPVLTADVQTSRGITLPTRKAINLSQS